MGRLDISQADITNMRNEVQDFSVDHGVVDDTQGSTETYWDYPNTGEYLGYYKNIPEIKATLDTLGLYVAGLGYETDSRTKVILERITGWGEDNFTSIIINLSVMSYALGDSFAEIVRGEDNELINIKPLDTASMRVIVNNKGMVKSYEYRVKDKPTAKFKPHEILHLVEGRVMSEIHGTSKIEAVQWIVDAKNEAMDTQRKMERRGLAMGILELDTEDSGKISAITSKYQDAVNKGEVLVTQKGLSEVKAVPTTNQDKIAWLQYLDSKFYETIGVPKVLVTSEGFTEAGGKVGFLTFQPVYTFRQVILEADLWNQLGIKVKFNRPPSLAGTEQANEQKNTGQLGIQPGDTQA